MQITADPGDVPSLPAGYVTIDNRCQRIGNPFGSSAERGQGFTTMRCRRPAIPALLSRGTLVQQLFEVDRTASREARFKLITEPIVEAEWDGQKKKVVAAVYCDRQTMAHHRVSASAFVVACGPLSFAQALFNSGCNDHPDGWQ